MPYTIIAQIVLKLIQLFIGVAERREKMKLKMFEFVDRHDKSALENVRIRNEYKDIIKRIKSKEKV